MEDKHPVKGQKTSASTIRLVEMEISHAINTLPMTARAHQGRRGIKLNRLQPEAGGAAVNVVLEEQSFNSMLAWLHQLERNNGVQVVRITVNSEDTPGYVNAQVKLQ